MATKKRRRPGVLPPTLTPQQRADARRCFAIGVRVAMYFARRKPTGLTAEDLLWAADEAVVLAVCTHDAPHIKLETYVWARVESTLKTLVTRTAERLGQRAQNDTYESQVAEAGGRTLGDYALAVEDPTSLLTDGREQHVEQYDALAHNGGTALAVGGAGHQWHMRGEPGFVQRAEYVRGIKTLHDAVAKLPPGEATVVELRCFREMELREVAKEAGVSEKKVSRLIEKAIPRLRAMLESQGFTDISMLDGR